MKSPHTGKKMRLSMESRYTDYQGLQVHYHHLHYICDQTKEKFTNTPVDESNLRMIQREYDKLQEFVPYEEALQLRKLGYDSVATFGCWIIYKGKPLWIDHKHSNAEIAEKDNPDMCAAPLWQQAFDWFRMKHDFPSGITPYGKDFVETTGLAYPFESIIITPDTVNWIGGYSEYDEARISLLKALIKFGKSLEKEKKSKH